MAHEGQKIAGKSWVMQFSEDAGTTWLTTICEKGTSFKSARDEQDASSKCGNDLTPGDKLSETLSTTLYLIQGTNVATTEASYKKIYDWKAAKTTVYWRLGPAATTLAAGALRLSGQGWFKSADIDANYDGNIEVSIEFVAYPDLTVLTAGV